MCLQKKKKKEKKKKKKKKKKKEKQRLHIVEAFFLCFHLTYNIPILIKHLGSKGDVYQDINCTAEKGCNSANRKESSRRETTTALYVKPQGGSYSFNISLICFIPFELQRPSVVPTAGSTLRTRAMLFSTTLCHGQLLR